MSLDPAPNDNTADAKIDPDAADYCKPGDRLSPYHLKLINESGVIPEVARERGYRTADKKVELKKAGFAAGQQFVPSLLIPLYDSTGQQRGYQHRPDTPRLSSTGKAIKYESLKGARPFLDLHPRLMRVGQGDAIAPILNPAAPIIITEGTRKADAAVSINLCAIGLVGVYGWRGRNPADGLCALVDWENIPLNGPQRGSQGRVLLLTFDSDVMQKRLVYLALSRLKGWLEHRGASVGIIYLPPGPHGEKVGLDDWIAARKREGKDAAACRAELLALAVAELRKPADPAGDEDSAGAVKYPFRVTKDAVQFAEDTEDSIEWVKVCSPLEIAAQTRNEKGELWGRLLRFPDPDGTLHEWAMPMSMMAGDGNEYRQELLDKGLTIAPGPKAKYRLHEYVQTQGSTERVRCVSALGWHGDTFVYPDRIFGLATSEPIVHQSIHAIDHKFRTAGSLPEWQKLVAEPCRNNSRLIFTVSMAFAAPLIHHSQSESGGLNWWGPSTIGKTTLLVVGGSVVGGGDPKCGFLRQWRTTANALEGVATTHCDSFLALDELAQVGAAEAGQVAYLLANGQAKARSNKGFANRPTAVWRALFCSTGELSLADKIAEDGRRTMTAGQGVRVLDVPADAGAGFGCFEQLHRIGHDSRFETDLQRGKAFAEQLKDAALRYYGTAIREYLARLTADLDSAIAAVEHTIKKFVADNCPSDADPQVGRACNRFALIAAGGELAIAFDIVPWSRGAAEAAAQTCFRAWLEARPAGHGRAEIENGIAQVRKFIELHGESRFAPLDRNDDRPTVNRAGFRRSDDNGGEEFLVLPEVFRREVCAGHDASLIAKALAERGQLIPDQPDKDGRQRICGHERIPGLGTKRIYRITAKILAGDAD